MSAASRPLTPLTLEICVGSLEHAVAAERAGADRLELCAELAVGGTTPGRALMKAVRESVRLPIYAMVRPRGGDFVYSAEEFDAMKKDILEARECGMDGIVLGVLDATGRVDAPRTKELVDLAHPLPVTFHRAFDEVRDSSAALEAVIATGARRILTSGGKPRALDGLVALEQLVNQARRRIAILPGSGIDAGNVAQIVQATGAREVHASLGLAGGSAGGLTGGSSGQSGSRNGVVEWQQKVQELRGALEELTVLLLAR